VRVRTREPWRQHGIGPRPEAVTGYADDLILVDGRRKGTPYPDVAECRLQLRVHAKVNHAGQRESVQFVLERGVLLVPKVIAGGDGGQVDLIILIHQVPSLRVEHDRPLDPLQWRLTDVVVLVSYQRHLRPMPV